MLHSSNVSYKSTLHDKVKYLMGNLLPDYQAVCEVLLLVVSYLYVGDTWSTGYSTGGFHVS